MTTLVIPDNLAQRLRHVTQQENRPMDDVPDLSITAQETPTIFEKAQVNEDRS